MKRWIQDRKQWRVFAKKDSETLDSGQTTVASFAKKTMKRCIQDRQQWRVFAKKENETLDLGQKTVAGFCEKRQ